jgi:hypothetical protein
VSRIWADGVDWEKHTNGLWAPERQREPRGGPEFESNWGPPAIRGFGRSKPPPGTAGVRRYR